MQRSTTPSAKAILSTPSQNRSPGHRDLTPAELDVVAGGGTATTTTTGKVHTSDLTVMKTTDR